MSKIETTILEGTVDEDKLENHLFDRDYIALLDGRVFYSVYLLQRYMGRRIRITIEEL